MLRAHQSGAFASLAAHFAQQDADRPSFHALADALEDEQAAVQRLCRRFAAAVKTTFTSTVRRLSR